MGNFFEIVVALVWVAGIPFACSICWRSSDGHPMGLLASALWPIWMPFYASKWDARLEVLDYWKRRGGK